jgi:hypothetical protein
MYIYISIYLSFFLSIYIIRIKYSNLTFRDVGDENGIGGIIPIDRRMMMFLDPLESGKKWEIFGELSQFLEDFPDFPSF